MNTDKKTRARKHDEYGFITVVITAEDGTQLERFTVEPQKTVARQNYLANRIRLLLAESFIVNPF